MQRRWAQRLVCLLISLSVIAGVTSDRMISSSSAAVSANARSGRLAFSAHHDGNWDIYSIRADGSDLRRITDDSAEDRSPAWSPDGKNLAFQSNRNGNWDIYVISVGQDSPRRLTSDPEYDGAPAWSPDGKRIAFESYREGDLDILTMNADGSSQSNLTPTSPAGDFDPSWSPDGAKVSFTSWRMGDNDVFIVDLETGEVTQCTTSSNPEGNAVWSDDGGSLAYVRDEPDRREIYIAETAEPTLLEQTERRLTWYSRDDSPAWSPTGDQVAYISHQHTNLDAEYLLVQDLGPEADSGNLFAAPDVVLSGWEIVGPLSWTAVDNPLGRAVSGFKPVNGAFSPSRVRAPIDLEVATWDTTGASNGFEYLLEVEAPNARLDARLIEAFRTTRESVLVSTGHDFLAEVSDMWRGIDKFTKNSAYLSWHKAGRAFDTLFDYRDESNLPLLEVVREDIGGETFWRLYLKAALQDGSLGMPLKTHPWDLSGNARRRRPEDGGTWKPIPYGYYVDVTRILRHCGWERLAAIDRREFSWRWHFLAIEYWHHQWRNSSSWYEAMTEVYPASRVAGLYGWEDLVAEGEEQYNILMNGVPIPSEAEVWRDVRP